MAQLRTFAPVPVALAAVTLALLLVTSATIFPTPGRAEVERLEITTRETVAGGRAFGLAGPYEKLAGTVHFALDPEHPGNRRIVDLGAAPRAEDGRVHFSADLHVLKPVDPGRGNGTLFFEVSNRGSKAIVRYFSRDAARTLDPTTAEDFGDAFLLRRGFTLAWVGWQFDVPPREGLLRLNGVFAETDPPIEGLVRADHVFAEPAKVLPLGHRGHWTYPVADADDPRNLLTVRDTRLGEQRTIPRSQWRFAVLDEAGEVVADPTAIHLAAGFEPGKIYEAVYVARRPAVVGLGHAAVRDFISFAKHSPASPVQAERALGMGISQTGRYLRHFLYQGFNEDLEGRRAFDGLMVHTAGAGRGSFNHRFAQPSRDAHPFSAFFYPTDIFPFSSQVTRDGDRADGLFKVLEEAGEDLLPKVFFTNSGYEYWGRAASLIHTEPDGSADLEPPPNVRVYHLAGAQHFVDRFPPRTSGTRYPANPANFFWALRAFVVALDGWVRGDVEPPPSRVPRIDAGTLVAPGELEFPALPGVEVPRRAHEAYRMHYGDRFASEGVVEVQPPEVGKAFAMKVSQVDGDGNEVGGLRLPEIAVPVATYTPWNWRSEEIGAPGELADFRGAFLPFAASRSARSSAGDPRPSLEERYGSYEAYLGRYAEAAVALVREGYLLAEDLPEILEHAGSLWQLVAAPEPAQ